MHSLLNMYSQHGMQDKLHNILFSNLVIENWCRACTTIIFSHCIQCCGHTSCLLGPSAEGRSFSLLLLLFLTRIILLYRFLYATHSLPFFGLETL